MKKESIKLPLREEIPSKLTWDLTLIFKNDKEFEKELEEIEGQIANVENRQGSLSKGSTAFLDSLEAILQLERRMEKAFVYANLKNDQDTGNKYYQGFIARARQLYAKVGAGVSWFEPELLELPIEKLKGYFNQNTELLAYKHLIAKITAQRKHFLSAKEEELLAGAADIFSTPENIFGVLNNSDLKFPEVRDAKNNLIQLSHGNYGRLLESPQRSVRRAAFTEMYQVYQQFQNTFALSLAAHVHTHNYLAQKRCYPDARSAALTRNNIPVSVYKTLVEQVNHHLPLLHRYVSLRKKILKINEVHMYDLYTPVTKIPARTYSYKDSQEIVLKALSVLGNDYTARVKEAFENRWIDVVENKGKRSGAYSSGMYDTAPYILLNWQNNLESLFTLIHEMGHSMHTYASNTSQDYHYSDYSIFVAEIASTTNENLLTQYLLEHTEDPHVKAYILNHYLDGFKGTIFRQTQFAEFEQWIHEQDAEQKPLTAKEMNAFYADLNKRYYGPDIFNDSEIAYEWERIPHFYYNFYVYQYATGFAAASALAQKILTEGPNDYLNFLSAGSSDFPIEIVKKAGVDMTETTYLESAFGLFEKRLDELEKLITKLS
ncbi:oligoendopeptidase F [Liquorilactobacillus sucicola DSM 21376 = JCM 15457]|uniref:Oligopeptidase F n=1 Tax=Liquorilactobacillus sucicola DSM 21376 = JCM 15457 TaxID=1423806 RepID=A0A023CVU5_9LACO|nr:oligoendopeptidase F [Liquorilactobacillus sucicola]KRN06014.1 oligoendopeptidase F [Liquorilactobacillus sucicola DSM 21376 = JCM 15457]GAJ25939.1 oligoendopeptidase F [Liquorilactobacillus sucicola DSM 21376 = JCM 15457]